MMIYAELPSGLLVGFEDESQRPARPDLLALTTENAPQVPAEKFIGPPRRPLYDPWQW